MLIFFHNFHYIVIFVGCGTSFMTVSGDSVAQWLKIALKIPLLIIHCQHNNCMYRVYNISQSSSLKYISTYTLHY